MILIAVIFQKIPVKEQLNQMQNIKRQLEKLSDLPIHITCFDFYSFFNKGNFAKEGILFYGKSLIFGKYFSENFGLIPKVHISYSLKKLKKKDKVRMNYLLNGKRGNYGLLRQYSGMLLNPGLIEILPQDENMFVNAVKKITQDINVKHIFLQEK